MADELTEQEKRHLDLMREAVKRVRGSNELRYFFRQLLQLTGMNDSLNPDSTSNMMFGAGRQSVGNDLAATLMSFDITLYADLLKEDALNAITETDDV